MPKRYEFYVRVAEISFLPREHKIQIFEPTCHVLFIIWRPHEVDIFADFYFIVFEKLSQFYKSPLVFIENTKHPCTGYRNSN